MKKIADGALLPFYYQNTLVIDKLLIGMKLSLQRHGLASFELETLMIFCSVASSNCVGIDLGGKRKFLSQGTNTRKKQEERKKNLFFA
jgi:hypothetical protein